MSLAGSSGRAWAEGGMAVREQTGNGCQGRHRNEEVAKRRVQSGKFRAFLRHLEGCAVHFAVSLKTKRNKFTQVQLRLLINTAQ